MRPTAFHAGVEDVWRNRGRILVIGGEPGWRQTVGDQLLSEGFHGCTCSSGQQSQATFERPQPDLVVIATEGPGTASTTLCEWIRLRSGVPIVALADTSSRDAVELLKVGADVVLPQPVSWYELLARLRAMLRRMPPRSLTGDQILRFGGMKLDRHDQVLTVEEGSLCLEGREFVLIEALMLGGTKVTPRRQLEARLAVTGSEFDACVRRLRQRIEAIEPWRRIVSERGVGLRLLECRPARSGPPMLGGQVEAQEAPSRLGELIDFRDREPSGPGSYLAAASRLADRPPLDPTSPSPTLS